MTNSLVPTINKLFATKTPAQFIKSRPGAEGKIFKYVEIGYVVNCLNAAFGPFWEFKVIDKQIGKKQLWVQGQLTIKDPKGGLTISKETFGGANIKKSRATGETINISADLKSAVSDCIKKCASMLGIAADVFYKEQDLYDMSADILDVEEGITESTKHILTNKMFAMAAERGFKPDHAKALVKSVLSIDSISDMTEKQLEDAIKMFEEKWQIVSATEEPLKVGEFRKKPEDLPF